MKTRQELYIGTGWYTGANWSNAPVVMRGCESRTPVNSKLCRRWKSGCGLHNERNIVSIQIVNAEAWGSVKWRQIVPVWCGYGYEVIAQIEWQRQTLQRPFAGIHADLQPQMGICESQVRALYHYRYLPLLACHERHNNWNA